MKLNSLIIFFDFFSICSSQSFRTSNFTNHITEKQTSKHESTKKNTNNLIKYHDNISC